MTTAADVGFEKPRNSSGEGGTFWPGREGTFVGELTGFEKGPEFDRKDKNGETVKDPSIRWMFDIYKLDGTRVMYTPEEGDHAGDTLEASKDGLSSTKITSKSKAGEWFQALLQRELDFDTVTADQLMEEAIGKRALLVLSKNEKQKIVVRTVARYEA